MNARIDLSLSRREFLKASGALVVSAGGPAFIGETLAQTAAVSTGSKPPLLPTELDSWVAIAPNGRVTAFFGKMDMGQSLDIAIAQIVADELDVDVAKVRSEEHTSELQSRGHLVCRLLLEKKK